MLAQSCGVRAFVSRDRYNKKVYGASTNYPCRHFDKREIVRAKDGQEKVSNSQVWLNGDAAVGEEDEFTDATGKVRDIVTIERPPDEGGSFYYVKVFLS